MQSHNACSVDPSPHTEAFQAVVWHLLVSHPEIKRVPTKWGKAGK
jgi:D-sedoheptulose 7-phosphate isomerase